MTRGEFARRRERAEQELFVVSQSEEGYQVYAPSDPKRSYSVTDKEGRRTCTCTDFQKHAGDPDWQCKHGIAVQMHLDGGAAPASDRYEDEERQAIREEARVVPLAPARPSSGPQMVLKRSVSPDGRIDSLSVAFAWPLEGMAATAVKARVDKTLALQKAIVDEFLGRHGRTPSEPPADDGSSQAAPARMIGVGGMEGRWGRRLFLTFDVGGRNVRFFGTQKQLAAAVADAGYPKAPADISEGLDLGLPCRLITKPTADGRFLNVERVLPPTSGRTSR